VLDSGSRRVAPSPGDTGSMVSVATAGESVAVAAAGSAGEAGSAGPEDSAGGAAPGSAGAGMALGVAGCVEARRGRLDLAGLAPPPAVAKRTAGREYRK
jgi:hypothetical protein